MPYLLWRNYTIITVILIARATFLFLLIVWEFSIWPKSSSDCPFEHYTYVLVDV